MGTQTGISVTLWKGAAFYVAVQAYNSDGSSGYSNIEYFFIDTPPRPQIQVWANDGGDKVTRDELRASQNPANLFNSVWDGQKVSIFGARNEVVSFNLIIESPAELTSKVTVSFNTLTGPNNATITSTPATGNGVFNWTSRNIELFYVRYLKIKGLSTDIFYENNYDERHVPERLRRPWTGEGVAVPGTTWVDRPDHNKFYPDIAIPLELLPHFEIGANQNQSIWVDIYIPKTSSPGNYQGTITIQINGDNTRQIPVELTVRSFTLPDLPRARTMLCYSQENINYRYLGTAYLSPEDPAYAQSLALINLHFQLAHRHKISMINGSMEIDKMDEGWTGRLSGDLFTPANGYTGPGVGVGNNVYSIGTYGSWVSYWDPTSQTDMWSNTDAWVNWFDAKAFSTPTEYFLYLIDESSDYAQIEQWAKWIDNNPGPGSRMMSMATGMDLSTALAQMPSLDIPTTWVTFGDTETWQKAADAIVADPTKKLYLYNGGRSACGTFAIEDDGVALRVLAWTQYKKKCDRWFYWESTYYDNYQAAMGQTDVFESAHTYGYFDRVDNIVGETGWNYLNGDGVLFYPGTDTHFKANSYDVAGPFASLRLKHWRRGLQDVDYLTMAAAIDPVRTAEIVNAIIPKVAWEVDVTDPEDPTWVISDISWSTDPDVWEKARADLANIIEVPNPSRGMGFYVYDPTFIHCE